MMRNVKELRGYAIRATNGVIGTVMTSTSMTKIGESAISSSAPVSGRPFAKC